MKLIRRLNPVFAMCVTALLGGAAPAGATDLVNGGFETGDFTGWTLEYGQFSMGVWSWGLVAPPGHPLPLVIDDDSQPASGQLIDVDPPCHTYAARINDAMGATHATRLRQSVIADADCPASQLSLVWKAVLQDGGHLSGGQAELQVEVLINGTSVSLTLLDATDATQSGSGWTNIGGSTWFRSAPLSVALPATFIGDAIEVRLSAFDCQFGGHGGMAFLDCVQLYCPATMPYCTSGTTTNGCFPNMTSTGIASASAAQGFTLGVNDLEGMKPGLFFYGINGDSAVSWGPGSTSFMCVKAPVQRLGTQSSGGTANQCDGSMAVDWNAYIASNPSALGNPFAPGTTVWAQAWFRDPPAPKTTNLTHGVQFTVGP